MEPEKETYLKNVFSQYRQLLTHLQILPLVYCLRSSPAATCVSGYVVIVKMLAVEIWMKDVCYQESKSKEIELEFHFYPIKSTGLTLMYDNHMAILQLSLICPTGYTKKIWVRQMAEEAGSIYETDAQLAHLYRAFQKFLSITEPRNKKPNPKKK